MSRRRQLLVSPSVPGPFDVRRSGREGVWWERGDGLEVRVAAPERDGVRARPIERARVSLLGVLLAGFASGRAQR